MNKQCYRIIFSRTHGELRVVSELAGSCSSPSGQRRGAGMARLWVTVRPVMWLVGMALFSQSALANGIVADGQVAAGQRPEVTVTQNGLQQVNINAPNQAGVSHNQYQQFDVDKQGAILNNSAVMTSTQLGGYIQGNGKLDPNSAPAKVIINEVNSNNPSQLRGFLEVAGGKTQVVVANPAGIVCDGCGTINAGRMTLTTGKPQLNADGSLAGYKVERGIIRIEGGGLNGDSRHDTEYADILARAVQVNAGVWAHKEVNVVAGRNQISADTKMITPVSGTDDKRPEMAIDMGQLGGMYSGAIRMMGTEAGVGVRNQGGTLQADKTLTVSSEGKLVWQAGTTEPQTQAGGDVTLTARDDVEHHGKLFSGGKLVVQSREGVIKQSGTLAAAGYVTLHAAQGIDSRGHLLAGSDVNSSLVRPADLTLESLGDIRASGSLMSQQKVSVTGRRVDASQSRIAAGHAALASTAGDLLLNQTQTDSELLTLESQGDIYARQAVIRAGNWQISATSLFNQGGIWSQVGADESRFDLTGTLDNTDGSIESRQLSLNTSAFNNLRGRLVALNNSSQRWRVGGLLANQSGTLGSNGSLQLEVGTLDNRQGTLQSQANLTLSAQQEIDNRQGKLLSAGSSTISARDLINSQGEIHAFDSLDMQLTRTLDNGNGNILSQRNQYLQAANLYNNQGWIGSLGSLTAVSQSVENRDGEMVSQQDYSLKANTFDNQRGTLQSAADMVLAVAQDLMNQGGKISAQTRLWLQGVTSAAAVNTVNLTVNNSGGQLLAGEQLLIQARNIDNQQSGLIYSQKQLQLQLVGLLDNRHGTLQSDGSMELGVNQLLNNQGVMTSLGNVQLTANQMTNDSGIIISQGLGDYHIGELNNQRGKIHSGDALNLSSLSVDNRAGQLVATRDLTLEGERIDNSEKGIVSSKTALIINAAKINNRDGGLLIGTTHTALTTHALDNTAGRVQSSGTLTLSQLDMLNNYQGSILSNNTLSIGGAATTALAIFNQDGNIQSGGELTVATRTLDNLGGTLLSQKALNLSVEQDYTHRNGDILSSNTAVTLRVAGALTNLADWLLPGTLTLTSTRFTNLASLIGQTLNITTGTLLNQGRIEADNLTINSDSLDNQTTLMADNLTVNSRVIDNHGKTALIAATQNISLMSGERLTNRDGGLIYSGGTLQLTSKDLIENRASNIEAEGNLTLTARRFDNLREGMEIQREAETGDYSWHRYNYYWRSYDESVNTDVSTMAPTTQKLTFRDDTAVANNPYGTLLEIDVAGKRAQVQVKNDQGETVNLWVNYLALIPHANGSYDMTFYETRGPRQNAGLTPYQNTVWWEATDGERIDQWDPARFIDIANAPYVQDYNNLRERTVRGTVITDRLISAGTSASLLSGGNMILHVAEQLLNEASTISANGDLTLDGNANVINRGYSINERRQEIIVDHYDQAEAHWYPTHNLDQTTALTTLDGVITGHGNVSIGGVQLENTTVNQAQISNADAAQNAAEAERTEWEDNPLGVDLGSNSLTPAELTLTDKQHVANVATTIADNGLFVQQPSPSSPYLVVTDPRFTSKTNFISSDYLLKQLNYDPSQALKRLGDGYYEQRVVREQLLMLTGRPSLHGEDAMGQYQTLMNNGTKAATDVHLVPGIALTPAQIAALQQDIVWLVSETVDTGEGTQTVWVPKVYLTGTTLRLGGDGSVIAGSNLQLSTGSVQNAGNLFADNALNIDTNRFLQTGGELRADSINVKADSITLSTNLQDALRQASMSARDINLSGSNINLQGASLSADNNLSLNASNNLTLGTARSSTEANVSVISGAIGNRNSAGIEKAGDRLALVSGEWQQALGSSLNAGGNLSLQAGQDITLQGSQATAGGNTQVQAGGNVSLLADTTTNNTHLDANSRTSSVSNSRREETLHTSALGGDNGVTIRAGGDFMAEGAQVESKTGAIGLSAQQVMIKEARQTLTESDSERASNGNTQTRRETQSASDTSSGSLFSAKQSVTVIAREGDISVQGSTIQSDNGTLGLNAAGDISLTASRDEHHLSQQGSSQSSGLLSSSQSAFQREEHSSTANGSLLSGQEVILQGGRDINLTGSAIAATDDVSLQAGNNITLVTAENSYQSSYASQSKKSGLSGTGGIGFSYGTQNLNITDTDSSVTRTGSTVGSTQGNVTLNAGNNLTVKGSDLLAAKDLTLRGKEVNILAADKQNVQTHAVEQKQSGFTLALTGAVGSAMSSAVSSANDATTASTGRLATLDGMKSALNGVQTYQASQLGAAEGSQPESLFGLNLSYGSQSSKSEQTQTSNQSQGSTLTAGGSLTLHASDTDLNVQGSQLQAGKDISLSASRDVNLWSGVNTSVLDGSNESHGGSVGIGLNFGQGSNGLTLNASGNKGQGSESGSGTTHSETMVSAGNHLTLVSGRDITLTGAQISGDRVIMDVGRNLTLSSEQDSDNYDSKQQNASAGISGGLGSFSGSLNLSQDKMHSSYDSVKEQTGIFAGKGGFDIVVGEHTQLDGAVIGSTASADKNRLDTGTLGFEDIANHAEYDVEHQSVGIGTGGSVGGQFLGNMANGLLVGVNGAGSADSTTHAAISDGSITLRDREKQTRNVDELSRDVEHANHTLSPIFDREKEQQRLQEAQKIGEIGSQAADITRTQGDINGLNEAKKAHPEMSADELRSTDVYKARMQKYGTGSALQQGIQAATAAIQGLAGGDVARAIAGGSAPYLAEVIHNMTTDPVTGKVNREANLMAHAVVGAVVAQINGNSALAGTSGAAVGELVAQQLYPDIKREDLTEEQRQTVSALSTLAAGLAGGLTGDSPASMVAGAQAGKNAVENNALSTNQLDGFAQRVRNCTGDSCQQVVQDMINLNIEQQEDIKAVCSASAELCQHKYSYLIDQWEVFDTTIKHMAADGTLPNDFRYALAPVYTLSMEAEGILANQGWSERFESMGFDKETAGMMAMTLPAMAGGTKGAKASGPKVPSTLQPFTNPAQGPVIPAGWVSRPGRTPGSTIYYPPNTDPSAAGSTLIRVMPSGSTPVPGLENGYWISVKNGQPINPATGGTGSRGDTHVPLPPNTMPPQR